MTVLRLVGYWRSGSSPEWPDPTRFIDESWDEAERHVLALYLSCGTRARVYRGYSTCRICGKQNGDSEYTDGEWLWPSGLAHYVSDHAVRLPAEFSDYAIRRMDELEAAQVDRAWWSEQHHP